MFGSVSSTHTLITATHIVSGPRRLGLLSVLRTSRSLKVCLVVTELRTKRGEDDEAHEGFRRLLAEAHGSGAWSKPIVGLQIVAPATIN